MPDTQATDNPPGVATLVGGLIEDTQRLIRQEAALARHEIQGEWDRTKEGVGLVAAALAFFTLVAVLFGFTLVKLLYQYVLPNDEWACFAIVTFLFALGGGVLLAAGLMRFRQVHVVPPQTVESLRRDVQAMTSAVTERPVASPLREPTLRR
jgi:hypothetical protein